MGLRYRRRVRITPKTWASIGLRSASVSRRVGHVTASTTGRVSVRLGKGWSWRSR